MNLLYTEHSRRFQNVAINILTEDRFDTITGVRSVSCAFEAKQEQLLGLHEEKLEDSREGMLATSQKISIRGETVQLSFINRQPTTLRV